MILLLIVGAGACVHSPSVPARAGHTSGARTRSATLLFSPDVRYFVAGGVCAAVSHGLACPIDVVKTRQQAVPAYRNVTLLGGLARVAREEGPAGLFTGLGPTVVGYGVEGACKFGVYEQVKLPVVEALSSFGPELSGSLGPLLAGVIAGGLASLVLAPTEATRIRLVSDPAFASESMLGAARRLVEMEGSAGLLRGIPATCSKQLPYTATKQVSFDALLDLAASAGTGAPHWLTTAGAAFAAAMLSALASQPGDTILSEVSCRTGPDGQVCAATRGGIGDAARRLGPQGLVRGLRARLVQVGLIVTVQLILYDYVKHAFGLP